MLEGLAGHKLARPLVFFPHPPALHFQPLGFAAVQGTLNEQATESFLDANLPDAQPKLKSAWFVSLTSLFFVLLQSACTAVMAISGVRLIIGLGALAAASGLGRPASGFHQDAIRIPMLLVAVVGSAINLYVIWRIRSLRNRPASQWRMQPPSPKQLRSERFQIALAVMTLALVLVEWFTHRIIHNAP